MVSKTSVPRSRYGDDWWACPVTRGGANAAVEPQASVRSILEQSVLVHEPRPMTLVGASPHTNARRDRAGPRSFQNTHTHDELSMVLQLQPGKAGYGG